MRSLLVSLLLVLIVGCDGGTYEHPSPPSGNDIKDMYVCIDGFTYRKYSHSIAPIFDKKDRLPKRCSV